MHGPYRQTGILCLRTIRYYTARRIHGALREYTMNEITFLARRRNL